MKILVVSAVKFEVKPLLIEMKKKDYVFESFEIGIGPLKAARSSKELEKKCHGAHVIYVGTCGVFVPLEKPYLISAKETHWMPAGVRSGISDINPSWEPPVSFEGIPQSHDLQKGIILTSPEISLTKDFKNKEMKENSSSIYENMELYCVAEALKKSAKLDIILGVTNEIGPNSRSEWKENFKKLAKMSKSYILNLL